MCRLTPQLAGRRKTAPAPTGGREQPSTTTWPTRTTSRKPICSCTTSIGRLGRLKSCYDRGSRIGDRYLSFSSDDDVFCREVRALALVQMARSDRLCWRAEQAEVGNGQAEDCRRAVQGSPLRPRHRYPVR